MLFSSDKEGTRSGVYLSYPYVSSLLKFMEDSLLTGFKNRRYTVFFRSEKKTSGGKVIENMPLLVKKEEGNVKLISFDSEVELDQMLKGLLSSSLSAYVLSGIAPSFRSGDVAVHSGKAEPLFIVGKRVYPLNRRSALSLLYSII
jgi:hypothetical protein